jgi:hypothetical protein
MLTKMMKITNKLEQQGQAIMLIPITTIILIIKVIMKVIMKEHNEHSTTITIEFIYIHIYYIQLYIFIN